MVRRKAPQRRRQGASKGSLGNQADQQPAGEAAGPSRCQTSRCEVGAPARGVRLGWWQGCSLTRTVGHRAEWGSQQSFSEEAPCGFRSPPFCGGGSQVKAWLALPAKSQCAARAFGEAVASCSRGWSPALLHGEVLVHGEAKALGPETGLLGTSRHGPAWLRGAAVWGGEGLGDRQRPGKRWGAAVGDSSLCPRREWSLRGACQGPNRCQGPGSREGRGMNRAALPGGLPVAGDCCCQLASSSATVGL